MSRTVPVSTLNVQKLIEIAKRVGITYLALFGSYARGNATTKSDVDLAARFGRTITLFDLANAQLEMEQALGRKVDLIPLDSAYPFIRDEIAKEAITLFQSEPGSLAVNKQAMVNAHS
jgi:uncharacterized protein